MQIAIVDDVLVDRRLLSDKLTEYAGRFKLNFEINEFESAEAFFDAFAPGGFDIVFMDIYMNGMNGLEAAKEIFRLDRDCKIIFLTTTSEYSLQSYSVRAVYYLVKPISDAEFSQAMEFCALVPESRVSVLPVMTNGTTVFVDTNKILYIDYTGRVTRLHMVGRVLRVSGTFSEVTSPLEQDERFLLCIRGIMVNMRYIVKQEGDLFLLTNGERLPINIRKKKAIGQAYRRYVYGFLGDKV